MTDPSLAIEPINLSFRYQTAEVFDALWQQRLSRAQPALDIPVAIAMLCGGVACLLWFDQPWWGAAAIGVSLLVAAAYALNYWSAKRAARRKPQLMQHYHLSFSDDGVHFVTDGIDTRLAWRFYRRAARQGAFYLLFYATNEITVIPARVFRDEAERLAFEQLISRHLPGLEA